MVSPLIVFQQCGLWTPAPQRVAAVHTKAGLYRRSHALLKHFGTVSTSGSKGKMVRRLYDIREYAIAAYELDEAAVYPPRLHAGELAARTVHCHSCACDPPHNRQLSVLLYIMR
jgi:hypothetical protein